jgi:hypothetical protein
MSEQKKRSLKMSNSKIKTSLISIPQHAENELKKLLDEYTNGRNQTTTKSMNFKSSDGTKHNISISEINLDDIVPSNTMDNIDNEIKTIINKHLKSTGINRDKTTLQNSVSPVHTYNNIEKNEYANLNHCDCPNCVRQFTQLQTTKLRLKKKLNKKNLNMNNEQPINKKHNNDNNLDIMIGNNDIDFDNIFNKSVDEIIQEEKIAFAKYNKKK